ncbi:MAG: hypothetical protein AAB512_04080 [Patescibacteria group bacterium]
MDESASGSIFSKIVGAIFVLAVLDLMFINWWLLKKSDAANVSFLPPSASPQVLNSPLPQPSPSPPDVEAKKEGAKLSDSAKVTTTNPPLASPTPTVVVQTPNKEIFVPMGTGQTKSGTFADLNGVEIGIDTTKYSGIDYIVFEGSIWVDGGNGRAWAQIRNVEDNNPLIESQISNPTLTPLLKTSGKIPLPSGYRTYRVQAKTDLTEFAAHVENAHLKIVLK